MRNKNEIKIDVALKNDVLAGVKDLDSGRFQVFDDTNLMQLAEAVGQHGRARLNALRPASWIAAKVQRKK